jgi:putative SOS response-associated peptidase YedK
MASPQIGHDSVLLHRPERTTSLAVDKGDYLRLAITILANGVVKPVHNRVPVIFDPESFDRWLDPNEQRVEILKAMRARHFLMIA